MSASDANRLATIINECLKIKHVLAPESDTEDKKRIMEKIRLVFPVLEKRDAQRSIRA
jgi:hypothetical protein